MNRASIIEYHIKKNKQTCSIRPLKTKYLRMKTIKYIALSQAILLLVSLSGCSKYDDPEVLKPANMQATMTIKQLKEKYTGGATTLNDKDAVIQGTVISTDKYGNFYRSIYIQDATTGIEVKIGRTTLYNTYKEGQIVYVKTSGLCIGKYGGLLQLGYPSLDSRYETAYLDAQMIIDGSVFAGAMSGTPVDKADISSSAGLTEDRLSTLVTLKGATYKSGTYRLNNVNYPLTIWAKKDNTDTPEDDSAYGEHTFTLSDGTEIVVRTSGYSKFAENKVPFAVGEKGDLTGVLTRYNTTYQLLLNTDKDVVKVP